MFLDKYFEITQKDGFLNLTKPFKTVILDITDPILMSFETNNEVYTIYILEQKKIKRTLSFLVVKTSYEELEEVLNKKAPLRKLFMNKHNIEERFIDLRNRSSNINNISFKAAVDKQYLPSDSFYLDKIIPNKIDLEQVKNSIKKQSDILRLKNEYFTLNNNFKKDLDFEINSTLNYNEFDIDHEDQHYNIDEEVLENFNFEFSLGKYESENNELYSQKSELRWNQ